MLVGFLAVVAALPREELVAQTTSVGDLLGDRVRLRTSSFPEPVVGEVLAADGDSLVVVQESGATLAFPIADILTIERSLGRTSQAARGLALGAGFGFAVGAAGGIAIAAAVCGSCDPDVAGEAVVGYGLLGAFLGGIGGALIGSRSLTDRWESVELPTGGFTISQLHVQPLPDGRFGFGLRLERRRQ
jgi:hypothetical protein